MVKVVFFVILTTIIMGFANYKTPIINKNEISNVKQENKIENENIIDNLEISSIEHSYGGGFGTAAETATITIIINDDGNVQFTNNYKETLIKEFKIDETIVKDLENYINKNCEIFSKKDITNKDAQDAGSEYIRVKTKDGKSYEIGGYCVTDNQFNEITNKIIETAGKEEYTKYKKEVRSEIWKNIMIIITYQKYLKKTKKLRILLK